MSGGPYKLGGLKFRIGDKQVRVWRLGFEIGDDLGGRVYWFPWCKHFWRYSHSRKG